MTQDTLKQTNTRLSKTLCCKNNFAAALADASETSMLTTTGLKQPNSSGLANWANSSYYCWANWAIQISSLLKSHEERLCERVRDTCAIQNTPKKCTVTNCQNAKANTRVPKMTS